MDGRIINLLWAQLFVIPAAKDTVRKLFIKAKYKACIEGMSEVLIDTNRLPKLKKFCSEQSRKD